MPFSKWELNQMADFAAFQSFALELEKESDTRESIKKITKEIDMLVRQNTTQMLMIHSHLAQSMQYCATVRSSLPQIQGHFKSLQAIVTKENYYKYLDQWKHHLSQLVLIFAFVTFVEQQRLLTKQEAEKLILGQSDGYFVIELEDFLMGLCGLPTELQRLCVNSVTAQNYSIPHKVSAFVSDLYSAFRLLNLKNDALRKRYDSIKWDLKKIEEIVYDLSIRNLK